MEQWKPEEVYADPKYSTKEYKEEVEKYEENRDKIEVHLKHKE